MIDYAHPVYFKTGNTFQDAGIQQLNQNSKGTVTSYWRPKTGLVNIADCVDMHCDGHKKMMIVDETGDLIGYKGRVRTESIHFDSRILIRLLLEILGTIFQ